MNENNSHNKSNTLYVLLCLFSLPRALLTFADDVHTSSHCIVAMPCQRSIATLGTHTSIYWRHACVHTRPVHVQWFPLACRTRNVASALYHNHGDTQLITIDDKPVYTQDPSMYNDFSSPVWTHSRSLSPTSLCAHKACLYEFTSVAEHSISRRLSFHRVASNFRWPSL